MARSKGNRALATAALLRFQGDGGLGPPGVPGLVPAPVFGDGAKYLKGDGTWGTPSATISPYTEGTFVPVLATNGVAFTSVTADADVWGRYTQIGREIHFRLRYASDAITVGSATGNLIITGLPTAGATQTNGWQAVTVGFASGWAGEEPSSAMIPSNSTTIELYYKTAIDGNSLSSAVADAGTGANANIIYIGGSYNV